MGFLRKALFVYTGGASGLVVKANSKKERAAKAAEQQVRLQKQILKEQRAAQRQPATTPRAAAPGHAVLPEGRYKIACPSCDARLIARAGDGLACPKCHAWMSVLPTGAETAVASHAEPPAPATPTASLTDELERLSALHASGALSADEFATAKQKLLS